MIELKILTASGEEKFSAKGVEIDTVYNGEFNEGDKIIIRKPDTEYIAVKFDETLEESIIFSPLSTIEYPIPSGDLMAGYNKDAFSGDEHRLIVYEPDDSIKYGSRKISLNAYDIKGQKKYFKYAGKQQQRKYISITYEVVTPLHNITKSNVN